MKEMNWNSIRGELPGPKTEYYRPGNLSKINTTQAVSLKVDGPQFHQWDLAGALRLTFCGGQFLPELSNEKNLSPGVSFERKACPLTGAGPENKLSALQRWGRALPYHFQLKINAGVKLSSPIWIQDISSHGDFGFSATAIEIMVAEGAEVNLVRVLANDLAQHHQFMFTSITLAENSQAHITTIAEVGAKSWGLDRLEIIQQKNSNLSHNVFSVGGEYFRQELEINLSGEQSNAKSQALILAQGTTLTDHTTRIAHHVGHTSAQQYYKGILDESARAVFKGNFYVRPQAQKVNSSQLNKTLLLTNSCEILARPQLEIYADDVKCSHGATVGELDEQELFYLQSRGISADRARIMLAHGMALEIVNGIADESLRAFISNWVMKKLSAMNSLNQMRNS